MARDMQPSAPHLDVLNGVRADIVLPSESAAGCTVIQISNDAKHDSVGQLGSGTQLASAGRYPGALPAFRDLVVIVGSTRSEPQVAAPLVVDAFDFVGANIGESTHAWRIVANVPEYLALDGGTPTGLNPCEVTAATYALAVPEDAVAVRGSGSVTGPAVAVLGTVRLNGAILVNFRPEAVMRGGLRTALSSEAACVRTKARPTTFVVRRPRRERLSADFTCALKRRTPRGVYFRLHRLTPGVGPRPLSKVERGHFASMNCTSYLRAEVSVMTERLDSVPSASYAERKDSPIGDEEWTELLNVRAAVRAFEKAARQPSWKPSHLRQQSTRLA